MDLINYPEAEQIRSIIDQANHILIMQADNPDGDSLASSLALESILGEMNKNVSMYCAVDMPSYLKYLPGWDRVTKDLPKQFDAAIIVDASTMTLFEKLSDSGQQGWVAAKPVIVLDHHAETANEIPFAQITINDSLRASTGELIYFLAQQLGWPLSTFTCENIMTSILGDTQGLSNSLTTVNTYYVMAELVKAGVNRPALEEKRRESFKMPESIFRYKAALIERTEFYADGRVGLVSIPQDEISNFSPLYNPAPLIQNDILQVEGVGVGIVFKCYSNGRITAAIRCNPDSTVAASLARHFGGGGHEYASGFKIDNGRPYNEIKSECIQVVTELLNKLNQG